MEKGIKLGHSWATDARTAVAEFYAEVAQPDLELVIFFCSPEYELEVVASEIKQAFAGSVVVGCTTAGEIGPAGYKQHSICGVSFSSSAGTVVTGHLDHLQRFQMSEGRRLGRDLLRQIGDRAPQAKPTSCFAFLLIDGLSVREESVAGALQHGLDRVPLIGGSAGDALNFGTTFVFADGVFRSDRAVLTVIATPLPFTIFKTQHFAPSDQKLVITQADSARRVVKEINGLPAAEEYARLLGVTVDDLTPKRFAASPVVVLIDGNNYVRSIQKVNPDGSVTFYCAIDEGVVLRVARAMDLAENLEHALSDVRKEIGPPQLILGCDCVLRKLEIAQDGLEARVASMFQSNHLVGFNSYGEQFRGVHVNQTLTGIAIGERPAETSHA